jgi:hypothetical protein
MAMPFTIDHLDHFVLTVADIGVTIDFYTNALGLQATAFARSPGLTFGAQKIHLHQHRHEFAPKALIGRRVPISVSLRRSR